MDENDKTCCICGKTFVGWGNNPWPIKEEGRCCDTCNYTTVLMARIKKLKENDYE